MKSTQGMLALGLCGLCLFMGGCLSSPLEQITTSLVGGDETSSTGAAGGEVTAHLSDAEGAEGTEGAGNADVPPDAGPSDAEQIAELQESIEDTQKRLVESEAELENPESEYGQSEKAYRELDAELEKANEKLKELAEAGPSDAVTELQQEVASLERQRKLAEERFDLAIEDRKTLRELIVTLKEKLSNDKAALASLTGEEPEMEKSAAAEEGARKESDEASKRDEGHRETQKESEKESHRASEESQGEKEESRDAKDDTERSGDSEKEADATKESAEEEPREQDPELMEAEAEAEAKEEEAQEAEEETESLESRIKDLQKLIAQEQKELSLARRKMQLAETTQQALAEEILKRQGEGAELADLKELRVEMQAASQRLVKAKGEVNEVNERLNEHRADLAMLQGEHIIALRVAEQKQQVAAAAEERVEDLRNPFAPRNIMQWLLDHAPRLMLIICCMFVFNRIVSFFAHRSIRLIASGTGRGSSIERENRAKTLVGVFQNAVTVAIFITGILMVLEEVGANITVLMGGVAVVGLAVAFGAQNLIKDYFYGFVMLLENQYMLNDSVKIGDVSGQVERITLRMTVLRDSNGVVHFIPNGTINSVSNETHGWSRAVVEVAVGYGEDIDRVTKVLQEIATSVAKDPQFAPLMLEPPSDPSIDTMGESAITLKFSVKTASNRQGPVKQELLRRIRRKFTALGIQPPYPRRLMVSEVSEGTDRADGGFRAAG